MSNLFVIKYYVHMNPFLYFYIVTVNSIVK